jgi:hypothetical protein
VPQSLVVAVQAMARTPQSAPLLVTVEPGLFQILAYLQLTPIYMAAAAALEEI